MSGQSTTSSSSSGGIGFAGALTILFVALKLTHVIAWSWWWVLSPLWIGAVIGLGILLGIVVVALVATAVEARRSNRVGRSR